MQKFLIIALTTNLIVGCSTTNIVQKTDEPYCYTEENIQTNNGKVNSSTLVQCSDNPLKRAKLVGVDEKNCRRWERQGIVNGHEKRYGGYICRDAQGNWRPLADY